MTGDSLPSPSEQAGLSAVLSRFPEHSEALARLFRQKSSFQSLCEDYGDCLGALASWRHSTAREAPAMQEIYAELLRELEAEVQRFLEEEERAGFLPEDQGLLQS